MANMNPFDLLGDTDYEDPNLLVVVGAPKVAEKPKKPAPVQAQPASKPAPAKFPTKPVPPTQAVRESRNESSRGGGRGGGRSFGRGGGRGFDRDSGINNTFAGNNGLSGGYRPSEEGEAGNPSERRGYGGPRGPYRGGRRGGFSNDDSKDGERPRRVFERHSGTGRGNEFKREGAGRGNWGTPTDEIAPETEELVAETENISAEKPSGEEIAADAIKENPMNEQEEKEPEEKEMTLEEYEKVLEEKRKALLALNTAEERKVDVDKEFKSMQPLSSKKSNDVIFIKLGSEKDKRKDAADKEEKAKKSVSINEFLKPAEGERFYNPSGRGRGRGRGSRGGYGGSMPSSVAAPAIEDPGQFPTLGGK